MNGNEEIRSLQGGRAFGQGERERLLEVVERL